MNTEFRNKAGTIYGLFTGLLSLLNKGVVPCEEHQPSYAFANGEPTKINGAAFPTINTDPQPTSYTLAMKLNTQDDKPVWPRFGQTFLNADLSMGIANVYKLQPKYFKIIYHIFLPYVILK